MRAYLFGDTDIAAQRLRTLAEVYAEATRTFVSAWGRPRPRLALDLGCGPGHTTRLLADTLDATHTVGLDHSERFLSLAQQDPTPRVSFHRHDVTQVPFPTGPADLMFCRLLLTHVPEPGACLQRWGTQLQPRGRLLVQEVETIHTNSDTFRTYLALQDATLGQQANRLYVGPLLHDLPAPPDLRRRSSHIQRIPVPSARAATLFWLNFQTWKQHPFVHRHHTTADLERLDAALRRLAEDADDAVRIEWEMRELVYDRL